MQKPHRLVLDRMSGYADEAAAYLRRRLGCVARHAVEDESVGLLH